MPQQPLRFDTGAIRQLANAVSKTCYDRGESYFRSGQIELLSVTAERVVAEAFGSVAYAVRIAGQGDKVAGMCTCPAYEDVRFCKHMVAVMLAANAATAPEQEPDSTAAAIAAHLASHSKSELVDFIMALADTYPALYSSLAEDAGVNLATEAG